MIVVTVSAWLFANLSPWIGRFLISAALTWKIKGQKSL